MGKKQSCSSRFVGISSSIHLNESVCVCVCVGGACVRNQILNLNNNPLQK